MRLKKMLLISLLTMGYLTISSTVYATAIAYSNLNAFNLEVTPESGTVNFTFDWALETFAEAKNSLGEYDQDFDFSFFGGDVSADAKVTWAEGHGVASEPKINSSDINVFEKASSSVNVPGCDRKWASSLGRGSVFNEFIITGGTGAVNVDFSVVLGGGLSVATDECGILATTEVIFGLELDGALLLDYDKILSVGRNQSDSFTVSELLSTTVTLEYNVPYFLYLEVDSESLGIVPEPHTWALMILGLSGLIRLTTRQTRKL